MIIIRYNTTSEELYKIALKLKEMTNEEIIGIPEDMDGFLNYSLENLHYMRDKIDEAIRKKENEK